MYTNFAVVTHTDLKERFKQDSAPKLFYIRNEIHGTNQGHDLVAIYYNKVKTLWDQFDDLLPYPMCSFGAVKHIQANVNSKDRTIQFLLGLNLSLINITGYI